MTHELSREHATEAAKALYAAILETAGHFLHNAKHFSIDVLQDEDPSYGDVADIASQIADFVYILADDFDPMMHQKAQDYCFLMKGMAKAIKDGDGEELDRLTEILEKRPFL